MTKTANSFFEITANKSDESTVVRIHDEIGGWGIWAQDFIEALNAIKSDQITLDIFSPGGSVYHGLQIIDTIRNHSASFTAKIGSFAGSMATIIACACDTVEMSKAATFWIHRVQGGIIGDAETIREYGDDLEKLEGQLMDIYVAKTGKKSPEILNWMAEDRPWTAEEAFERGFIDELYDPVEVTASISPALLTAVANVRKFHLTPSQNGQPNKKMQKENNETEGEIPQESTGNVETPQDATAETNSVDVKAAIAAALKADRERQSEIRALGAKFGFDKEAEKFASGDESAEEFRKHILNKSPEDWKASLDVKNPSTQEPVSTNSVEDALKGLTGAERVAKIRELKKEGKI